MLLKRFTGSFRALATNAPYSPPKQEEGRLWAIALGLSLLGNLLIFSIVGFTMLKSEMFWRKFDQPEAVKASSGESTILITPDMLQAVREKEVTTASNLKPELAQPLSLPPPPPRHTAPDFTRTSEDQRGKRPDKPAFIGERNTEATSDSTPDPNAKLMPSQKGMKPRDESEIETTESRYRDGKLAAPERSGESPPPPSQSNEMPPEPSSTATGTPLPQRTAPIPSAQPTPQDQGKEIAETPSPAVPELKELLRGPNPLDVEVPKPATEKILPPGSSGSTTNDREVAKASPEQKPPTPDKTEPKPGDPGFRGHQRKTAIKGSISRTGTSALDVADTPLGRYQAIISRAVELEWQRNCVRHRDFITPGFLTVRFFIEPTGKVKSVQFAGEMQTGEVQKGFTLNSIRNADIPPMPKEIRGDYKDEPLELIFNFYF